MKRIIQNIKGDKSREISHLILNKLKECRLTEPGKLRYTFFLLKEDNILGELVEQHEMKKWATIAYQLHKKSGSRKRSGKQCR